MENGASSIQVTIDISMVYSTGIPEYYGLCERRTRSGHASQRGQGKDFRNLGQLRVEVGDPSCISKSFSRAFDVLNAVPDSGRAS